MAVNKAQRDKEITRQIHRLFWRANLLDKTGLIVGGLARMPAFVAYHILIPLVSAYAIQAIIERRFEKITGYALLLMGLALVYCVFLLIGQIMVSRNAIRALNYIQNTVFANFLSKDYEFFASTYIGTLGAQAARLRDASNGYGELFIFSVPKQAVIIVASVAVIGSQSFLLAVITIAAMGFILLFTVLSSSWRLKYRRNLGEASSEIAAQIGDALTHAAAVKSFAAEPYEEARVRKSLKPWSRAQFASWMSTLPADNGRMILAALTTALLLIVSARLYQAGTISITIVVLIQIYVIKLISATSDIAEIVKRYEEVMGAAYEPVKTMLLEPIVTDRPKTQALKLSSDYRLVLKNVTYRYPDAAPTQKAINGLNLTVNKGEKIGVVGYSGSGKTTLTKLILRFMDVSTGKIELGSKDIREVKQSALRSLIAYVPQEPILFHRTISENIAYGNPGASKQMVLAAAKHAYVDEFVDTLPHAYQTYVGERGVKLSGGQRQRVAIARALLKDAPILLLDEATSALDSKSEQLIQEALWKLMENRTAIVIAHRLSTIQRMDRIVVMDKGRIVQEGTHTELKSKPGIYADLWEHQSGGYLGDKTTA